MKSNNCKLLSLCLFGFSFISYSSFADIYCPSDYTKAHTPVNEIAGQRPGEASAMTVVGKSCKDLHITARNNKSHLSAGENAVTDAIQNGKYYFNSLMFGFLDIPGLYAIINFKNQLVGKFESLTDAQNWDGAKLNDSVDPFNLRCATGAGVYILLGQSLELKNDYDPTGNSANCPVDTLILVCDPEGTPGTSAYTGQCVVNSPAPKNCGDASLDLLNGEECDLGTAINQAGQFGCTAECKKMPGWTCTSTPEEFNKEVVQTKQMYNELADDASTYMRNQCSTAPTDQAWCTSFYQKLELFMILNKTIPVECSIVNSFTQKSNKPYNVNCTTSQPAGVQSGIPGVTNSVNNNMILN